MTGFVLLDVTNRVCESRPGAATPDLLTTLLDSAPRAATRRLVGGRSLRRLAAASAREWVEAGLGPADCDRLAALFELARRWAAERLERGQPFERPKQVFDHYHPRLRDEKREVFAVVLLDARHRMLGDEIVSVGSLTSSIVHPREVFRPAVREAAGAIVLVHNHPSGDPRPSEDDIAVTGRLRRAADVLGIAVLDHVIIGDGTYTSFREEGLL